MQVGKLRHKATRRVARGGRASRSGFASDVLKAQTRRRFGLGEAKVGGIADGETGQRPLRTPESPRSLPLSPPSKREKSDHPLSGQEQGTALRASSCPSQITSDYIGSALLKNRSLNLPQLPSLVSGDPLWRRPLSRNARILGDRLLRTGPRDTRSLPENQHLPLQRATSASATRRDGRWPDSEEGPTQTQRGATLPHHGFCLDASGRAPESRPPGLLCFGMGPAAGVPSVPATRPAPFRPQRPHWPRFLELEVLSSKSLLGRTGSVT